MMRLHRNRLALLFMTMLVVVEALLSMRQPVGLKVGLACEFICLGYIFAVGKVSIWRGITTEKILAGFIFMALLSSLSLYSTHVEVFWEPWVRLLLPISITVVFARLFFVDPKGIEPVKVAFAILLLLALYKAYENSINSLAEIGWTKQTNWGDAIGAVAPMMLLLKRNWLRNFALFIFLTAALVSLKRTAFLVSAIVLLCYVPWKRPHLSLRLRRGQLVGVLSTVIIIITGLIYLLRNEMILGYIDMISLRLSNARSDNGSGRLDLWSFAFDYMSNSSFLNNIFGFGYGWYHENWARLGTGIESMHNDLIEFWFAFGLVGVVIYFSWISRIAYLSIWLARHSVTERSFALSVFPVYTIYSLLAGTFFYYFFFLPLFVAIGYLEARYRMTRRERREVPPPLRRVSLLSVRNTDADPAK